MRIDPEFPAIEDFPLHLHRFLVAAASCAVAIALITPVTAVTPDNEADATARRGDAYFHLMRARLALSEGRASEVAREVRSALENDEARPDLQGEGALLLAMVGRRTDAEELARKALASDPKQPAALRVLADLAASRSFGPAADPEARVEAIRLYEILAGVEERPPDELWAVLSRLKLAAGDADGAVSAAREFMARRPGEPGAVRLLAQTLEAVDRNSEALDVLLDWVRTHPEEDGLIGWISEWARGVERWEEVERGMTVVLEARPDSAAALALRGEARLRLGRSREAIDDLERARGASPESVLLRFQLATAYGTANRFADATETARALAADLPDNAAVRGMLGDALARQGDLRGASAAYEAALKAVPGADAESVSRRDDLRIRLALATLRGDDLPAASRALDGLEESDRPEALEARAELALRAKQAPELRRWAEALRRSGNEGTAMMFEAHAYLLDGRVDRSFSRFEQAAKILGPGVLVRGAGALREADQADRGARLLRDWVKAEPESPEAHFQLGGFLERTADFASAEPVLREAARLAPDDPEVLNYLGYSLADRGVQLEEALALVRRAVSLDPWNGAYLDSLGWALFRMGRPEEARDPLERAARELPYDPTILTHLGDLYRELGLNDLALGAWTRAIDAGADDAEALREKMGRVADGASRH